MLQLGATVLSNGLAEAGIADRGQRLRDLYVVVAMCAIHLCSQHIPHLKGLADYEFMLEIQADSQSQGRWFDPLRPTSLVGLAM